ncbi:MAG: cellulose-binding protein [Gomphosphaeria aponina SAG 52.96 = DSM 107014]|uniref:Cellulose-binding protein n=1 Tax=Gomphosphaeria aponina SAG 52.96 = DSM 107014 TaxID=1521640 RepID=A0A941GW30_9CHRO|nr:cellulose-binding protein [Gomphosphaeria aponina SAG 52.96 = DSM 107014]
MMKNAKKLKILGFVTIFSLSLALVFILKLNFHQLEAKDELTNQAPQASVSLGTNLNVIADWSTEMPFLDAFKSSRQWITQCQKGEVGCSGSWGSQEYDKLDLDENGWVKSLPKPEDPPEYTRVSTLMFTGMEGNYPGGKYVVLYEGEGTIKYDFDAQKDETASQPQRDVINVTPSGKGIQLIITATDPKKNGNYLRNIRVVQEQYETTYQAEIFNPVFLEKISKYSALRFMDWMGTNNSEQGEWSKRPKIEQASYAYGGKAPREIMVALANRLKADPWFNMPHKATDEYLTNFAQTVKDSLDPSLTIYVEYSNEVWNPQFEQFHWVRDNGAIPGGKTPYQSYGVRTAQMCDIWKGVFGTQSNRVKCVMGTQTSNPWVADQVLNCDQWQAAPCYQHGIDVLAITGYFSGMLGKPENEKTLESWLDSAYIDEFAKALTQLKNGSVFQLKDNRDVQSLVQRFNDYSTMAKEKGLNLVVYEGGSHVVGLENVVNNERITQFFTELHRRPEFYHLYREMLAAWQDPEGVRTLFMHFTDIGSSSKWGSWGALENVYQESSPRYDALMDFIASLNSKKPVEQLSIPDEWLDN